MLPVLTHRRRTLCLALLATLQLSCGPLLGDRDEIRETQDTVFKDGRATTGCFQGVVMDGITGARIDPTGTTADEGVFALVRGRFIKAKATAPADSRPNLAGEYVLCGVPLDDTFPIQVRLPGYQHFKSTSSIPSTIASQRVSAYTDQPVPRPVTEANIRLFPATGLVQDLAILVHHNGAPVEGATVVLQTGSVGNNQNLIDQGSSSLVPETVGPNQTVVTAADGLATFAAASIVWGGVYSAVVYPPAGGAEMKVGGTSFYAGLTTTGRSTDPFLHPVELPITDIELTVLSQSSQNEDFNETGALTFYLNRDVEILPGSIDNVVATTSNAATAALAANVPGNDASETVTVTVSGRSVTLTPVWTTNPSKSVEPGLRVNYSGLTVRPTAGKKLLQTRALAGSVSIYGGVPIGGVPTTLTAATTTIPVGEVSQPLAEDPTVTLFDNFGSLLAEREITWTVLSGDGTVGAGADTTATTTTAADGTASIPWTFGAAGTQQLEARINELTVTFTGTVRSFSISSGDGQRVLGGQPLAEQLVVEVLDQNNNPLVGETVTFAVDDLVNGGSITAFATTDGSGLASATWTTGTVGDTYTATATYLGLTEQFTATAQEPTTLVPVSGDNQDADAGDPLPLAIVAQINDQNGDPIEGVTLNFAANDGGTPADEDQTSNAMGQAQIATWTLGVGMGAQTLDVTTPDYMGVTTLTFNATAN